jgi:hypothetical protein
MSIRLNSSLLLASAVAAGASAAPLLTLGDNTELFVNAAVELRFDDNIFLTSNNEESDVIFSVSPGVEIISGKEELAEVRLFAGVDLSAYASNDEQNSAQFTVLGSGVYRGARLSASADASYRQLDQNATAVLGVVQEFIERDLYSVGTRVEYGFTPKISGSAALRYDLVDYTNQPSFVDTTSWTVPLNVYYKFRPKLDLSAGYRYRVQEGDLASVGGTSHYFNVGARGEIAPKLNADLSVGIETREPEVGDDSSILAFDGGLSWEVFPKITSRLTVGRSFDVSALGTELERTDAVLSADWAATTDLTATASVSWQNTNYVNSRDDDFYQFSVGVSYVLNQYVRLTGGYSYRTTESNFTAVDFSNNILRFGASVRY